MFVLGVSVLLFFEMGSLWEAVASLEPSTVFLSWLLSAGIAGVS